MATLKLVQSQTVKASAFLSRSGANACRITSGARTQKHSNSESHFRTDDLSVCSNSNYSCSSRSFSHASSSCTDGPHCLRNGGGTSVYPSSATQISLRCNRSGFGFSSLARLWRSSCGSRRSFGSSSVRYGLKVSTIRISQMLWMMMMTLWLRTA